MSRSPWSSWTCALIVVAGLGGACGGSPARVAAPGASASPAALLPARLRRLTNFEYENTVSALLGVPVAIADRLPPDLRQDGYTPNAGEPVSSAWQDRLDAVAAEVARRAARDPRMLPSAPPCADRLIDVLGPRAWRRPLEAAERAALRAAFDEGSRAGGFEAGAEAVLTALLEAPSFLYVTELGSGGPPGTIVTLRPYEIASLLSYTLRGGPPDDALLEAARAGVLSDGAAREAQARRLLSLSDTRRQFRRFALEWLEVDGLRGTTKNADLYSGYEALKPHMLEETEDFVDEVMVYAGGSIRGLLDARFASVDPEMARFYGLRTWGARASLVGTGRGGVLQQASFLAVHAHEDVTSPVERGDFVLRRLLCTRLPRPGEVGIETVFPPPSPQRTTRERFAAHADNPACSGCHERLDALGFAFESFDAVGARRATEHGRPIDTQVRPEIDGAPRPFADSFELSSFLARDPRVVDCYLRQALRFFTAQSDPAVEDEIVALARAGAGRPPDDLFEALLAFVRSDLFIRREVRP